MYHGPILPPTGASITMGVVGVALLLSAFLLARVARLRRGDGEGDGRG